MTKPSLQDRHIEPKPQTIDLSIKKITIDLELATVFLAILSIAGQTLKYTTNYDAAFGLIPLVNMAKVLSVPTVYAVLIAFITTVLFAVICEIKYQRKDQFRGQWLGLTILSLYTTLDRGSAVNTYVFKQFRRLMHAMISTYPSQKWVTVLPLMVILFLIFYPKFIAALPKKTKILAVVSLAIYYVGFMFIERFALDYKNLYGLDNLPYNLLFTVGKTLEISGLVAGLHTLLDYLKFLSPEVSLLIAKSKAEKKPAHS